MQFNFEALLGDPLHQKYKSEGIVDGETIHLLCAEKKDSVWRDGHCCSMTTTFIGDHMFSKPEELRRMVAADLATAVRLGRDAGYRQALAEVRAVLGIKDR